MSNVPSTFSDAESALPPVLQLTPLLGIEPSQVKLTFGSAAPEVVYASAFGEKSSIVLKSLGARSARIVYAVIPPSQWNLYDSVFGSSEVGALCSDPPQFVADSGVTVVAAPPGAAQTRTMDAARTVAIPIRLAGIFRTGKNHLQFAFDRRAGPWLATGAPKAAPRR